MVGSLTWPRSEPVVQPCGFVGHWEMFPSGRGTAPRWEGEGLRGAIALPGGPHLLPPQQCSQGSQGAFPCPEKGTPLQQPPARLARCSLPAISPTDGGSRPTGCLPGQSVGSTGPYRWASHGQGSLPSLSAPDPRPRGASPVPATLGPGLGALPWPRADRCRGMLKGPPLQSHCRIRRGPAEAIALVGCVSWWGV